MSKVVLFNEKKDCCGCGACVNICFVSAIKMVEDKYGFIYPQINTELCVECGVCKEVCGYNHISERHSVKAVYAAASKDDKILEKSASGGVSTSIAKKIISDGGIVYGATVQLENGKLEPKHIRIERNEELIKLQGSKYVKSEIGLTYKQVKNDLLNGRNVMFTGLPCQIAGLKQYLMKDYDNLLLIEIICHGVPSKKFFQDFISYFGILLGGKIEEFNFRDKSKGQGIITRTIFEDSKGMCSEKVKPGGMISYVYFFLKSYIYRINCYSCPYASSERVADLTIGDFWGFHEEYPNYNDKDGLTNEKGISCLLVNTEKGYSFIDESSNLFILMKSTFEKVAKHNDQLYKPSEYNSKREVIFGLYNTGGYEAVENYFNRNFKKDILLCAISSKIPKGIKRSILKISGKMKRF